MVEDLNLGDLEQIQLAVRVKLKGSASGLEVKHSDYLFKLPTVCQGFFYISNIFKIAHL